MKEVIDDVYKLIKEPSGKISDEWCEKLGKDIAGMLKNRLLQREEQYNLRLSSLGQGDRKLWYSVREETPKEEFTADTLLKFLYGDVIELIYIGLIEASGHEVTCEQEEVELNGIKGHIDCLVDGKLVDIKSASTFSFQKFQKEELQGNDPFGYYAQLACYSDAKGVEAAGWFVMDKQMGKLCFSRAFEAYLPNMGDRSLYVKSMVERESEPEHCALPVPDGKSGNMKLPTICSYCSFKKHCWRNSNGGQGLRTFIYSTGARFLTNVTKIPNVTEVL